MKQWLFYKQLGIKLYIPFLIAIFTFPILAQQLSYEITPYGKLPLHPVPSVSGTHFEVNSPPDEWEQIGPNGITAGALAVDPQDANIIYAGGLSGIYKTTNGGANWAFLSEQIRNYGSVQIAIHPTNSHILLAWLRNNRDRSLKLMRSIDAGINWITVLEGEGSSGKVLFDPLNPQRLFANANLDFVYRSLDGGSNWTSVSNFSSVNTIALSPQNPDVLYAVTNSGDLHKTTNGGQSWFLENTQLPTSFTTLLVSPNHSDTLFAGDTPFENNGGFYRSTDGGSNWSLLTNGFGPSKSIKEIFIDPTNSSRIYAGGRANGLYRSDNLGDQWTLVSGTLSDNYIQSLFIHGDGTVYCGFGANIYQSSDHGASWHALGNNLQNLDVFNIVHHPVNPDILYANTLGGVFKSLNGGTTWQQMNNGILDTDLFSMGIDPLNPEILYAGSFGGLVYKTSDGGTNWIEKSNGLAGFGSFPILKMVVFQNSCFQFICFVISL